MAGRRTGDLILRVAVYYAPAVGDPLWEAGCDWLGRDPETGAARRQPPVPGLPELTAEPRRYGFHATLKPPMRLASSYGAFVDEAARVAAALPGFALPPLAVHDLRGFLALGETEPCAPLQALADACVTRLDVHRAPPSEAELARRRQHGLPPAQEAMLARWGYPHVLETWFFHMTLTRRLDDAERAAVMPAALAWFGEALAAGRRVADLAIYTEAEPGAAFLLAERLPLRG